jgi:hypothetical protein
MRIFFVRFRFFSINLPNCRSREIGVFRGALLNASHVATRTATIRSPSFFYMKCCLFTLCNFTSTIFARFCIFEACCPQSSKIFKNVKKFQIGKSWLVIVFSGFYALNHSLRTVQYFNSEKYSQNLKILENFEKIIRF